MSDKHILIFPCDSYQQAKDIANEPYGDLIWRFDMAG